MNDPRQPSTFKIGALPLTVCDPREFSAECEAPLHGDDRPAGTWAIAISIEGPIPDGDDGYTFTWCDECKEQAERDLGHTLLVPR